MKLSHYQLNLINLFQSTYWEEIEEREKIGREINKFLKLKPLDNHQDILVTLPDKQIKLLRAYYCEIVIRDCTGLGPKPYPAYIRYMFEIQELECL